MALRELFAVFGVDFDTKNVNSGVAAVDGLTENITKFGSLLAASWFTHGVYEFGASVADFADDLADAGAAAGLSAKDMLTWRTVAASVGVGAEQFRGVLGAFARNVGGARDGNRDLAKSFSDIGVALRDDVTGEVRGTNEVLADTLSALSHIEDPSLRAQKAMKLLGEQGARLLPAFENGSAGLEEMRAEVERLFGGSLEEAAAQADELEKQTALWDLSMQALKTTIGLQMLPAITELSQGAVEASKNFTEMTKGTHVIELALTALGIAAAIAGVRMIIPFLPAIGMFLLIAAGIGIVILVIDDLIAMFTGGNSVIAEFIDTTFGVGTSAKIVEGFRAVMDLLNGSLDGTTEGNSKLVQGLGNLIGITGMAANAALELADAWDAVGRGVEAFLDLAAEAALFAVDPAMAMTLHAQRAQIEETTARASSRRDTRQQTAGAIQQRTAIIAATGAVPTSNVQIRQTNPITIQVTGAEDDGALAEMIDARIRGRQQQDIADLRDNLVVTAD